MRTAHRRVEHAAHHVIRLRNRCGFPMYDEPVALDPERNRKRVFKCRKILIEFSKEPEMIGQAA